MISEYFRALFTPDAIKRDRNIVEKAIARDMKNSNRIGRDIKDRSAQNVVFRIRNSNRDIFEMDANQVLDWVVSYMLIMNIVETDKRYE